jgi:glycerate kinase
MRRVMQLYFEATYQQDLSPYESPLDFEDMAGTGASGGLVAGFLACFKKAKIIHGMDFV